MLNYTVFVSLCRAIIIIAAQIGLSEF